MGHGTLQGEGPEREVGREVPERRGHLAHLFRASDLGFADTKAWHLCLARETFPEPHLPAGVPRDPILPNSASVRLRVTPRLSVINSLWE